MICRATLFAVAPPRQTATSGTGVPPRHGSARRRAADLRCCGCSGLADLASRPGRNAGIRRGRTVRYAQLGHFGISPPASLEHAAIRFHVNARHAERPALRADYAGVSLGPPVRVPLGKFGREGRPLHAGLAADHFKHIGENVRRRCGSPDDAAAIPWRAREVVARVLGLDDAPLGYSRRRLRAVPFKSDGRDSREPALDAVIVEPAGVAGHPDVQQVPLTVEHPVDGVKIGQPSDCAEIYVRDHCGSSFSPCSIRTATAVLSVHLCWSAYFCRRSRSAGVRLMLSRSFLVASMCSNLQERDA